MIMTEEDIRTIGELVERFFEGETTLDEERWLYRFFASGDIPAGLERYRDVFRGFGAVDGMACGVLPGAQDAAGETPPEPPIRVRRRHFRRVLRAVGIAAAVSVIAMLVPVAADIQEHRELADLYGGSYMIVNGKRTDDLKRMRPDIERALRMAERAENMAGSRTVEETERYLLGNIGDPAERERVRRLLSDD